MLAKLRMKEFVQMNKTKPIKSKTSLILNEMRNFKESTHTHTHTHKFHHIRQE